MFPNLAAASLFFPRDSFNFDLIKSNPISLSLAPRAFIFSRSRCGRAARSRHHVRRRQPTGAEADEDEDDDGGDGGRALSSLRSVFAPFSPLIVLLDCIQTQHNDITATPPI